jgi:DNA replication and repair protein RecF
LDISFDSKINILLGDNAQGKSNLLESIYLLSMGKSFRTARDAELIRFEEECMRVKGIFDKGKDDLYLEIIFSNSEKRFKINGVESRKNSDLLENAYIVAFSPDDLQIVKEEPEKRRKYLDRELFLIKPLYFKDMSKYKKSLMQRNALLKNENIDDSMLDVWDENLVYYGCKIIGERNNFIKKLKIISREIHGEISGQKEKLELEYESNIGNYEDFEQLKLIYKEILLDQRDKDILRRTTTRGPHKDDLSICINGIDVRRFGSQGQQRTAALSLKLAELRIIKEETGEDAIILLDDVLSELDKERQLFLIESLSSNQIFISAAEISYNIKKAFKEGKFFNIKKGEVINNNDIQ